MLRRTSHNVDVAKNIRYSQYLRPWMMAYAEWLILGEEVRTITARIVEASQLSRSKISQRALGDLEGRRDFMAYCDELARGPLEQARAKYMRLLPEYIAAHKEALDGARQDKDWKTVASIAESAVDRVLPKKQEAVAATQVNVVISAEQLKGFAEYTAPEVEVEALPAPDDSTP